MSPESSGFGIGSWWMSGNRCQWNFGMQNRLTSVAVLPCDSGAEDYRTSPPYWGHSRAYCTLPAAPVREPRTRPAAVRRVFAGRTRRDRLPRHCVSATPMFPPAEVARRRGGAVRRTGGRDATVRRVALAAERCGIDVVHTDGHCGAVAPRFPPRWPGGAARAAWCSRANRVPRPAPQFGAFSSDGTWRIGAAGNDGQGVAACANRIRGPAPPFGEVRWRRNAAGSALLQDGRGVPAADLPAAVARRRGMAGRLDESHSKAKSSKCLTPALRRVNGERGRSVISNRDQKVCDELSTTLV